MSIVLGLDFGTDSVRAIAVETDGGRCVAEANSAYARWARKDFCDPTAQCFRQHPLDYLESMTEAVRQVVAQLSASDRSRIRAIGVDATGSTVCPVDAQAVPLALHEDFAREPLAMFQIWKDLSAGEEAAEINAAIVQWRVETGVDYAAFTGDYSAERFWAKALRSFRARPEIRRAAAGWLELADWIPNLLVGCRDASALYRCSCAAAHKAMWSRSWNGLPDGEFLRRLDPDLVKLAENYAEPKPATVCLGRIDPEWADRLGLHRDVLISGSMLDAHAGAVGAGVNAHTVAAVLGTSTVQMSVTAPPAPLPGGICSVGEDSIIPGLVGLEAGQAAFGDAYAWLCGLLGWGVRHIEDEALTEEVRGRIMGKMLDALTAALPPADAPMALTTLDWLNGRRHPMGCDQLRSCISGLSLGTDAPELFRSLIFATAFGSKRILEGFGQMGAEIERVMAVGGIAKKSPYIMQVLADVFEKPVYVLESSQACALGAAMAAAVACGAYGDLLAAQKGMASAVHAQYRPDASRAELYRTRYERYLALGGFAENFRVKE